MPNQDQLQQAYPHEAIIYSEGLTKQFNGDTAVEDINLSIARGKIFGFIGPSGCGKTTTVRLLTGLYTPTSGMATVLGQNPTQFSQSTQAKIGYMPQLFVLYDDLSIWQNLNFAASLYGVGLRRKKRLNELLEFVELHEHQHKLVRNISGGMQRRLSLAATLVHNPDLLFLDEPTTGTDPVLRRKIWDYFRELQDEGRTLFITTQYVNEAAYCDYVGVLTEGRLLMVETPEGLRRKAFGGEVIDLVTTQRILYDQLNQIRQLPYMQGHITRTGETSLRLVVEEAGLAMPVIMKWCNENNLTVKSIDEYLPPFDDVFVELMNGKAQNE